MAKKKEKACIVYEKIKGKGRPRYSRRSGRMYTPKATAEYEYEIASEYKFNNGDCFDDDVPIRVEIDMMMEIPKSYTKKRVAEIKQFNQRPLKKPDIDNVAKIVLDALNGIAYADDKQVSCLVIRKRYTEGSEHLRIVLKEDESEN